MIAKIELKTGFTGLVATGPIKVGKLLFTYDEWVEDEARGWDLLTLEEVEHLDPDRRERFLHFGYDVDFGKIVGTFHFENALHLSNYINHSCLPTLQYNTTDGIIAKRDICEGEELTLDYGNFIVNVDQSFECKCGSPQCRSKVRKEDWKLLVPNYGLNFPSFMHGAVRAQLEMGSVA